MRRAIAVLVLCSAVSGVACGGDSTPSGGGTFTCGTGATAAQCAYNTQYCEEVRTAGSTTSTTTCRDLPAGCSGNPCDNCLSMIPGRTSCGSITFAGQRALTVTIQR